MTDENIGRCGVCVGAISLPSAQLLGLPPHYPLHFPNMKGVLTPSFAMTLGRGRILLRAQNVAVAPEESASSIEGSR